MVADFHRAIKSCLNEFHGFFATSERLVELECTMVLEGRCEDLVVQSVHRMSVRTRIDIEAVSSRETVSCRGVEPRDEILLVDRIL